METIQARISIYMTRLLIFCLTCIVYSSAFGQDKSEKVVAAATNKIAIFNLETDWWLSKKFDAAKSFKLSDSELKVVDEVFNICVNQNNIDTSYFHYKRQYVPFLNKDGQKKVWINCFCSDFGNDFTQWKKFIVLVEDGGSCFFSLIINLTDRSFSNFDVNGGG
jgi:hypothetical protein